MSISRHDVNGSLPNCTCIVMTTDYACLMSSPTGTLMAPCPLCEEAGTAVEMEHVTQNDDGPCAPYYYCPACGYTQEEDREPLAVEDRL